MRECEEFNAPHLHFDATILTRVFLVRLVEDDRDAVRLGCAQQLRNERREEVGTRED